MKGKCNTYDYVSEDNLKVNAKSIQIGKIFFTLLKSLPHFACLSYVASKLSIKCIKITFKKYSKQNKNKNSRFYSYYDIKYCMELIKPKTKLTINKNICLNTNYQTHKTSIFKSKNHFLAIKSFFKNFISKNIYEWHENFRFTSRLINMHIAAYLLLYNIFFNWLYFLIIGFEFAINGGFDFEIMGLLAILSNRNQTFNNNTSLQLIKPVYIIALIVPSVISFIICLIQLFLGLKSIKSKLLKLYKGNFEDVALKKFMKNYEIANSNTHLSGFLIGYLAWGYIFIFSIIFLLALFIIIIDQYVKAEAILTVFMKILPFLLVFLITILMDYIFSRFIFLQNNAKVLALNNYKSYAVYLYLTFFLDCFFGFLSALLRILKSLTASIFYMPRIDYAFTGRELEQIDSGYSSFVGYLYMEVCKYHVKKFYSITSIRTLLIFKINLYFFVFFFVKSTHTPGPINILRNFISKNLRY